MRHNQWHRSKTSLKPLIFLVTCAVIVGVTTSNMYSPSEKEEKEEKKVAATSNSTYLSYEELELSIESVEITMEKSAFDVENLEISKASDNNDVEEETECSTESVQSVEEETVELEESVLEEDVVELEESNVEEEDTDSILEMYKGVDEYLLAQLIYCEAGGTGSRNEFMYVGKVALNRMTTDYHDFKSVNTLEEVIAQKGQYASATKKKIAAGVEPPEECLEAAHALLTGEKIYYTGFDGEIHEFGDNFYWQSLGDISGWCKPLFETKCGHQYGVPSDE